MSAAGGAAKGDITDKMIDMDGPKCQHLGKKKELYDLPDAERNKRRIAPFVKELETEKQMLMKYLQLQQGIGYFKS